MSSKRRALGRHPRPRPTAASRIKLALFLCCCSLSWALPGHAADKTWTLPIGGSWTEPARWTGGVPTATDSATFNQAGEYTVYFSNVFQSLNNMSFSAGTVTFERLANPATLLIDNASGGRDLTVSGATLKLGEALPVNITVGDNTFVTNGGTLAVTVGSFLNTQQALLIDAGGMLAVGTGADVTSRSSFIGAVAGSTGTATVTGAGSTWMNTNGAFVVGELGSGVLTVQSGGTVQGNIDLIGNAAGSTGTATITGAGSSWNQFSLVVAEAGAGTMRVQDGGTVGTTAGPIIGNAAGSMGDVTVTGPGSTWRTRGKYLSVGGLGTGSLTIADSGAVNVEDFNGAGEVSVNALSTLNIGAGGLAGTLTTSSGMDPGKLINNGALNFNHTDAIAFSTPISGVGTITKTAAGSTTLPNASAFTGRLVSSGGQLILQGSLNASLYAATPGGTLRFDGSTVNLSGVGAIRASGGAVEYRAATVNGGILRGDLPGTGTHTIVASGLADTIFNGVAIQNSAHVVQDGYANFTNVTNGGRLTSNQFLFFDGGVNTTSGHIIVNQLLSTRDFTNKGQITVNSGGELRHMLGNLASGGGSRMTVNPGGEIDLLLGSQLDLNAALLVNNGTINGTTNVNFGSLATGTGAYGVVNVTQGGEFSPGNSPGAVTVESLNIAPTSIIGAPILSIELGGAQQGSQYDHVDVTGALALGGALNVSLLPGFTPSAGQSFDLLDWGSLSGTFASINLPALAGLAWNTSQLYTTGVLSVATPGFQEADFDEDGDVDGDDLARWRTGFGTGSTHMQGDANADADVDGADFLAWQRQLGLPAAEPATAAVPEPNTVAVALIALFGAMLPRLRRGADGRIHSYACRLLTASRRRLSFWCIMKGTASRSINRLVATRLTGAVIVFAWALSLVEIASAQSTVWVADGVGNWNVSGNWSNGVPEAGEFAAINNGGTARLFDPNGSLSALSLAQSSGNAGTLEIPGGRLVQTSHLYVGERGQGSLNVTNGGMISNSNSSIGVFAGSSGVATVNGAGSTWNLTTTNPLALIVGDDGAGTLNITGGGVVTSKNGYLARVGGSTGTVTVNGAGSTWNVTGQTSPNDLIVGLGGAAALNITGGGVVTSLKGRLADGSASTATVLIDGPGSRWTSSQIEIGYSGTGTALLTIRNGGALPGGAILGLTGTVRGDGTMGRLDNIGGVVAPGSPIGTLTVSGIYEQIFSQAKLQIELASNTSFDKFAVTGELKLASESIFGSGALEVSLVGGYVPSGTRSFDILDWGTQTGSFSSIILPTLGGTLVWNTSQLYSTGVISVTGPAATLTADFDEDTDVDAVDLAFWRGGFGMASGATHIQGDANSDGDADGRDFLVWQQQRGNGPLAAAVSEPATLTGVLPTMLLVWRRTRRHARLNT